MRPLAFLSTRSTGCSVFAMCCAENQGFIPEGKADPIPEQGLNPSSWGRGHRAGWPLGSRAPELRGGTRSASRCRASLPSKSHVLESDVKHVLNAVCGVAEGVQSLSRVQLFVTPWTAAHQASLSTPTPRACSNPCPSSRWCHPTISSSVVPFSSCLQSFPASGSFPMSQLFSSGGQSIGVSASASVLPMTIQDWFPLGWTIGSPCSPRDSQESSPTPQFKSTSSLVLSFLHSPTLTSVHDYWKNHSFDQTDHCQQSNVTAF